MQKLSIQFLSLEFLNFKNEQLSKNIYGLVKVKLMGHVSLQALEMRRSAIICYLKIRQSHFQIRCIFQSLCQIVFRILIRNWKGLKLGSRSEFLVLLSKQTLIFDKKFNFPRVNTVLNGFSRGFNNLHFFRAPCLYKIWDHVRPALAVRFHPRFYLRIPGLAPPYPAVSGF